MVSRDLRVRRLDNEWLVHFRADAPANLGFGLSDEAFQTLAAFGSGAPASTVPLGGPERMLALVDAGMLLATDLRLNGSPVQITLDEISALRHAIPVDATGMLELETVLLYLLARENQLTGTLVELGSYMGGSTIALSLGARASASANQVIAVDDHEWHRHVAGRVSPDAVARIPSTLPVLERNLVRAGVRDTVEVLVADTAAAATEVAGPVSLLLIDAGHDERSIRADIDAWFPKLTSGAIVAFHDYHNSAWPDVERVVDDVKPQFAAFASHQTLALGRMP
jgi:predicted O-methyltransferase YrrM